jgi:ribosomal protein S12 methylthiotransferase
MRRETSQQYIVELMRKIRAGVPHIALRTTFIVGFPGETEGCFESLLDFIRATKFERLGVFTYSKEDGTRAGQMAGQLSEKVKQKRRDLAMSAQRMIAKQVCESFVGRTIKVLVEGKANAKQLQSANVSSWEHGLIRSGHSAGFQPAPDKGEEIKKETLVSQDACPTLIARGEADAPDIDGRVYVRAKLPMGEFAHVKIIGHTDYDLIGEVG